jgi:exopolysaccharide biosynthesis polyprenyl glycosylphosphotransferase
MTTFKVPLPATDTPEAMSSATEIGAEVHPLARPAAQPGTAPAAIAAGARSRALAPLLVLAGDLGALAAAVLAAGPAWVPAILFVALAVATFAAEGEYRLRISLGIAHVLTRTVGTVAFAALTAALLSGPRAHAADLALAGALAPPALIVARTVTFALVRRLRRAGVISEPTVIIGSGPWALELARTLADHREYGLEAVGFLDRDRGERLPLPVLGTVDDLDAVVGRHGIRRVIVAFGPTREADMVKVLRASARRDFEVHVVPRFFELGATPLGPRTDDVWGIPLVRMQRPAFSARTWRTKRAFDLLVAGVALVLAGPLMLLIATAVRCSSRGPVLFRQVRIGQRGRPFELVKFRSMRVNDDSDTTWDVSDDERVTPVGRVLRRTGLDELPQLWNVLRGDMSLVGPRPERPHFAVRFGETVPNYADRHRVPVGVTGWAQVHGLRGDSSIEERARFDNAYIERWSPWLDLVILVRTVVAAFRGRR